MDCSVEISTRRSFLYSCDALITASRKSFLVSFDSRWASLVKFVVTVLPILILSLIGMSNVDVVFSANEVLLSALVTISDSARDVSAVSDFVIRRLSSISFCERLFLTTVFLLYLRTSFGARGMVRTSSPTEYPFGVHSCRYVSSTPKLTLRSAPSAAK